MNGIPSPAVGVWYLGPLPIRAYALAILGGIALGTWIWIKRYRARGGPNDAVLDIVMWAVPLGIIGARLYHVFSSPDNYFGPDGDPVRVFFIWEGGLGIWGAIPAGALGAWWAARRMGLRMAPLADAVAPGILVAQAIGRLGNYFNQELFGGPTTLPWGLQISVEAMRATGVDYPPGTLFHPTFLYELLWNLVMAGLLIYLDRKFKLRHGRVFWLYVALYTLGRLWVEMLRIDEAELVLGLRLNVWTSILVFVVALTFFVVLGRRTKGLPDPAWIPGREPEAEAEADSEGHEDAESEIGSDTASGIDSQSEAEVTDLRDPVDPENPADASDSADSSDFEPDKPDPETTRSEPNPASDLDQSR